MDNVFYFLKNRPYVWFLCRLAVLVVLGSERLVLRLLGRFEAHSVECDDDVVGQLATEIVVV